MFKPEQKNSEQTEEKKLPTEQVEDSAINLDNLTVADIKNYTQDLKTKIEAVKLDKEKDIKQKLAEHDILIAESSKTAELLSSAREALDYYMSMKELDGLNKDSEKKLQELQTMAGGLEKQLDLIETKLSAIASRPEIRSKIEDEAGKENSQFNARREMEKACEHFNPQIDQLASAIKQLANKKFAHRQHQDELFEVSRTNQTLFREAVERAKNTFKKNSDYSDYKDELEQIVWQNYSSGKLQQALAESRKSLGMFRGKEKAAIDFLLQSKAFQEYNKLNRDNAALSEEEKALTGEEIKLAEQLKALFLKAWENQSKIDNFRGTTNQNDLLNELNRYLAKQQEGYLRAAIGQTDKMLNYDDVRRNPQAQKISDTFYAVECEADITSLKHKNPKLNEQK